MPPHLAKHKGEASRIRTVKATAESLSLLAGSAASSRSLRRYADSDFFVFKRRCCLLLLRCNMNPQTNLVSRWA